MAPTFWCELVMYAKSLCWDIPPQAAMIEIHTVEAMAASSDDSAGDDYDNDEDDYDYD